MKVGARATSSSRGRGEEGRSRLNSNTRVQGISGHEGEGWGGKSDQSVQERLGGQHSRKLRRGKELGEKGKGTGPPTVSLPTGTAGLS